MAGTGICFSSQSLLPVDGNNGGFVSRAAKTDGADFSAALKEAQQKITFSKHALNRLRERNLELSGDTLTKLGDTVDRMAEKGARESLIYMDDIAMVVSVANRKVITAMDGKSANENIFTNIDSAAILR